MPKVLISIQFALMVDDEDDIARMARDLDESLYKSIVGHYTPELAELVSEGEDENLVDWYGATISIKRPVFEGVEE